MITRAVVLLLSGLVGLLVVGWAQHRVERPQHRRRFPVVSVVVLLLVGTAASYPAARRHREERTLSRVATVIVGHPVRVRCQTLSSALVDTGAELGYVVFDAANRPLPEALIKRDQCHDLQRYADQRGESPTHDEVVAVHVLTHESMHLRGIPDENLAECAAVQRDALVAVLLGAPPDRARALARTYWQQVYRRLPVEYLSTECADNAALDEGLPDAPWGPA